jgi:hypothetical protein
MLVTLYAWLVSLNIESPGSAEMATELEDHEDQPEIPTYQLDRMTQLEVAEKVLFAIAGRQVTGGK